MENNIFRKIVVVGLTVSLLSCVNMTRNINFYCYENGICTSYSEGIVYIGDKFFLNKIKSIISNEDVLVEDLRYLSDNPDMKIIDSYNIRDLNIQKEILNILCEYEKCYPSKWERSLDSMENEWFIHNLCYDVGVLKGNSKDVDLDNKDEGIYSFELKKVLKL